MVPKFSMMPVNINKDSTTVQGTNRGSRTDWQLCLERTTCADIPKPGAEGVNLTGI